MRVYKKEVSRDTKLAINRLTVLLWYKKLGRLSIRCITWKERQGQSNFEGLVQMSISLAENRVGYEITSHLLLAIFPNQIYIRTKKNEEAMKLVNNKLLNLTRPREIFPNISNLQ